MTGPFAGKTVLVTGAGKNIGRQMALDFAREGASVIVNGRADRSLIDATVAEINAAGGQAIGVLADVTDPAQVARMIEAGIAAFGGLDVVVSNAGLRRQTAFLDMTFSEWRENPVGGAGWRVRAGEGDGPRDDRARRGGAGGAVRDFDACRDAEPLSCFSLEIGARRVDAGAGRGVGWARDHGELRGARGGGYHSRGFGGGSALDLGGSGRAVGPQGDGERDFRRGPVFGGTVRALHHRSGVACEWRGVFDVKGECRPGKRASRHRTPALASRFR